MVKTRSFSSCCRQSAGIIRAKASFSSPSRSLLPPSPHPISHGGPPPRGPDGYIPAPSLHPHNQHPGASHHPCHPGHGAASYKQPPSPTRSSRAFFTQSLTELLKHRAASLTPSFHGLLILLTSQSPHTCCSGPAHISSVLCAPPPSSPLLLHPPRSPCHSSFKPGANLPP